MPGRRRGPPVSGEAAVRVDPEGTRGEPTQTPVRPDRHQGRPGHPLAGRLGLLILIGVLGLALRVALLPLGMRLGYPGDHDDFVRWGTQAVTQGPLTLYDAPPPRMDMRLWNGPGQGWRVAQREFDRVCNYPPGSAYLLYLSGLLHRVFESPPVVNTFPPRLSYAVWSFLADLLLALGCATIVGRFRGPTLATWTFALVLFLPPLWWDSAVWGQVDSTVLAPAVWMLHFMLGSRWRPAGLCWGLALAVKPHGVLFLPLWGLALLVARRPRNVIAGGLIALATLLLVAAPFLLHSGWSWWTQSYYDNIISPDGEYARLTTLKAFNLWYLDALLTDSTNAAAPLFGVPRSTWAQGLLVVTLGASLLVVLRRWRRDRRGIVLYAAVSLLCFMMLPTQVHERYLVLVLPFLAVAALLWPRLRMPLGLLVVVAMAQVTWPQWQNVPAGGKERLLTSLTDTPPEGEDPASRPAAFEPSDADRRHALAAYREGRARTRGFEWGLVILALSATVLVGRAVIALTPDDAIEVVPRRTDFGGGLRTNLLALGPPLLLAVTTTYGVLGVHYSTDTWIALAAGRQILTSPSFPIADTFSYTFAGATWFNQNWLSGVVLWLLYDHLGATGMALVMMVLEAGIVALVLATVQLRTGSWTAALLTAALVGAASRDWLGLRAATFQFLLLAALVFAASALRVQGERRRWWPLVVLTGTLAVWPHTHGSFVLGLGLLGTFVGCAVLTRLTTGRGLANAQLVALGAILAAGTALAAALSPFGVENLVHPLKVSGSDVFRQVSEWRSPFATGGFPPTAWYWAMVAAAAVTVAAGIGLRTASSRPDQHSPNETAFARRDLGGPLFDSICVALGLGLSLWARRFAPFFFILAAGPTVASAAWLSRRIRDDAAGRRRLAARQGAWVALAVLAPVTVFNTHRDLVERVRPRPDGGTPNLLERVVQLDESPLAAIGFLETNHIRCNLFTEWRLAGTVMFLAPEAKVFIDGRSQQLYDERHFLAYGTIFNASPDDADKVVRALDRFGTDAVLLPRIHQGQTLGDALDTSGLWVPILVEPQGELFVRRDTPLIAELGRRERAGDLAWPDLSASGAGRGALLLLSEPALPARAAELIRDAIGHDPALGNRYFPAATFALLAQGLGPEASAYLAEERRAYLAGERDVRVDTRVRTLDILQRCEKVARQVPLAPGP